MIRLTMLLAVGLLSACGQKGPLYFPPVNSEPYQAPERSAPPEFPVAPSKPAATTAEPEAPTQ